MSNGAHRARPRYSSHRVPASAGWAQTSSVGEDVRAYTLTEVVDLGVEARHEAEDGVVSSWSGRYAVRTDPASGVSVLVGDLKKLPQWPWYRVEPT